MVEEAKPQSKPPAAKKEKPPALEDKPFGEFIEQHFLVALEKALKSEGIEDIELKFTQDTLPIAGNGQNCWQVQGKFLDGQRSFNVYFLEESIGGQKAFSCSTFNASPSTIESFMIDERKITLDLLVLYTLQRLNGQKWLSRN